MCITLLAEIILIVEPLRSLIMRFLCGEKLPIFSTWLKLPKEKRGKACAVGYFTSFSPSVCLGNKPLPRFRLRSFIVSLGISHDIFVYSFRWLIFPSFLKIVKSHSWSLSKQHITTLSGASGLNGTRMRHSKCNIYAYIVLVKRYNVVEASAKGYADTNLAWCRTIFRISKCFCTSTYTSVLIRRSCGSHTRISYPDIFVHGLFSIPTAVMLEQS